MPALIPQRRPDKNNKIVTRWVKPDSASAGLDKMPLPGIRVETLQNKQNRLFDSFEFGLRWGSNEAYKENIRKQIAPMSEEAVKAALNTLDEHQGSDRVNHAVLHSINSWSKNDKSEKELLTSFRFAAIESVYEKYLKPSPLGNPQRASDLEEGIVTSLLVRANGDSFDNLPERRPLTDEESDQAVMAGYAAATVELHNTNISKDRFAKSDYWDFFQQHGELVGVFSEFRDRMDEVVDYVYRNGPDAGSARQYMRGDHIALSDGAL